MQGARKGIMTPSIAKRSSSASSTESVKTKKTINGHTKESVNELPNATSDAAELVLKEREKQRRKRKEDRNEVKEVKLEKVSEIDALRGNAVVDESELDRRQRVLHQQLEKKENEAKKTAEALEKLRKDLKALEEPIKAEIFQIRTQLEDANRQESVLVAAVNDLRRQLHSQEVALREVREKKQSLADSLIKVMADYEKRKNERLNEIASILGDNSSAGSSSHSKGRSRNSKPLFGGF